MDYAQPTRALMLLTNGPPFSMSPSPDRTPSDEPASDESPPDGSSSDGSSSYESSPATGPGTVRFEGQALAEVLGIRPQTLSGAVRAGHRASGYDVRGWAVWHPRASQVIGYDVPGPVARALLPPAVHAACQPACQDAHPTGHHGRSAAPQVTMDLLREAGVVTAGGSAGDSTEAGPPMAIPASADPSPEGEAEKPERSEESEEPERPEEPPPIQALMDMASRHRPAPEGSAPEGSPPANPPRAKAPTAEAPPTVEALLEASTQLLQAALQQATRHGDSPERILQLVRAHLQSARPTHEHQQPEHQQPERQQPERPQPQRHEQASAMRDWGPPIWPVSAGPVVGSVVGSVSRWPVLDWQTIRWVFGGPAATRVGSAPAAGGAPPDGAQLDRSPSSLDTPSSEDPSSEDPSTGGMSSAAPLAVYPQPLPPGLGR